MKQQEGLQNSRSLGWEEPRKHRATNIMKLSHLLKVSRTGTNPSFLTFRAVFFVLLNHSLGTTTRPNNRGEEHLVICVLGY